MSNEPDKVNSGALATMIVLVALATLAVALVVTALVRQETARLRASGDQNQERPFRQLRSEQESKLVAAPAWVDQTAGLASVSIDSAMKLVLEDVRENPLAMSPGNKPAEEEEEAPEGASAADGAESATGGSENGSSEDVAAAEAMEGVAKKPAPAFKTAPPGPAPEPKSTAPAPKSTAPAPKAPAVAPSPAPSTPAPGGPAQ